MNKILLVSLMILTTTISFAQTRDIDKDILTQKQQAELYNKNLEWKLDSVLPPLMRRENIDMWIIICFENSEDPVYRTLTTRPLDNARRLSVLIFHDSPDGFKKLSATWHGAAASGYMYESIFTDKSNGAEGQFKAVADYIRKTDPKRIGINYNNETIDDFSHANGLSHFHYEKLYNAIDAKYRDKAGLCQKCCYRMVRNQNSVGNQFFPSYDRYRSRPHKRILQQCSYYSRRNNH